MDINNKPIGNKISACLIVKGEADLFRCLNSIRDYVDEIIIVVNKDYDVKTKKIALQFTHKFYTYPWNNHFGDARNFSISKATKDWILIIDDDKFLTNANALREVSLSKNAYYVKHFYLNKNNVVNCRYKELFLFKNRIGLRFCGNIHEHLIDKNMNPAANIGILKGPVVYHTGYSTDEIMKQKFKRNYLFLQDEIKEPHSRKYFYLSRNYLNQAKFLLQEKREVTEAVSNLLRKSMSASKHYLSLNGDEHFKKDAGKLYDLSAAILSFQKYDEVKNLITMTLLEGIIIKLVTSYL